MKRTLLIAITTVLAAASMVFVDLAPAKAEVSARAISPAGSGTIYAIGTVGSDSIVTSYVRAGNTWYSGVASISGNVAIPLSNPMASPPTVYNFGTHLYAYISQSVLYNNKPALMVQTIQDWPNDVADNTMILILAADGSAVYKVVLGTVNGAVSIGQ